jgi:hypothetical protein
MWLAHAYARTARTAGTPFPGTSAGRATGARTARRPTGLGESASRLFHYERDNDRPGYECLHNHLRVSIVPARPAPCSRKRRSTQPAKLTDRGRRRAVPEIGTIGCHRRREPSCSVALLLANFETVVRRRASRAKPLFAVLSNSRSWRARRLSWSSRHSSWFMVVMRDQSERTRKNVSCASQASTKGLQCSRYGGSWYRRPSPRRATSVGPFRSFGSSALDRPSRLGSARLRLRLSATIR